MAKGLATVIIIAIVVIVAVGFFATTHFLKSGTQEKIYSQETSESAQEEKISQEEKSGPGIFGGIFSSLPSCGEKKELFSVSHISIENLNNIIPLGNFNPKGGHIFPTNHVYFHLKDFEGNSSGVSAPIVSPGEIYITRIASSEYVWDGEEIKDYKIDFSVCKEVRGYFIHLTSLSEKITQKLDSSARCNEYDTGGVRYKECEKSFPFSPLSLKTGESIGTVGGSSDFGLVDLRTSKLTYANEKRWYEDYFHRVCPLDYFEPPLKSQLKSLLGDFSVKRTIEPICGEVAQDVPGTAQGNWFVKGTRETYPEDPHITLAHDNIDPAKGAFSVGTSLSGLGVDIYYFDPQNSGTANRDFNEVTADGKIYCYQSDSIPGKIILQLTSASELKIEKQDGSCSGSFTFNKPTFYER